MNHYLKLIPFVEQNQDKIDWGYLSANPIPGAIHLLEQKSNKIDWYRLSKNPSPGAVRILEQNPDKIDRNLLSRNPEIFTYDYNAMKKHMYESGIAEELMQDRFHPRNLDKLERWGFESILSV